MAIWPLGKLQGSIFPPLLFNICMKPICKVFWSFELSCHHQDVDDTWLYLVFPVDPREAEETLNSLEAI